jgi:non-ribosomal peptide synthetase component F/thioesterase domain-containing protein
MSARARDERELKPAGTAAVPERRGRVCSQSQKRFWFEEQFAPGNPALNVAVRWRLEGEVSHAHVVEAWRVLTARHEALRTVIESDDGEPVQVVEPTVALHIPIVDLTTLSESEAFEEAERVSALEAYKPVDVSRAPLFRVTLVRVRENVSLLLLTAHHLILDGWSVGVLAREMGIVCAALAAGRPPVLPPLEATYSDYAEWEQDWLTDPATLAPQRIALEHRLRGFRRLELLTDKSRPSRSTSRSEIASRLLDRSLTDAVANLARRSDCTLFMTAYAALLVLLHRYTGEEDISIGTQVAGRDDVAFENLVGTFVNTVPLRADVSGNPAFSELLARSRESVTEALEFRHVPLEQVIEIVNPKRDFSKNNLFSVNFIFQRSFIENGTYGNFRLVDVASRSAGPVYDLNFFMVERPEGWRLSCEYDRDLFRKATVEEMIGRFAVLLTHLVADPSQRISDVPLMNAEERTEVLARSRGLRDSSGSAAGEPQLMAGQAARTAHAVDVYRSMTEAKIAAMLAELLGRTGIKRDTDIFSIGFHSLLALKFVARVKTALGVDVQLRELFERASIASIAEHIDALLAPDDRRAAESAIYTLNDEGRHTPLFFMHSDLFSGGIYCRRLAAAMGPDQPIHAVAPHGTAGLPLFETIEGMARDYLPRVRAVQPEGPYRLGGFCVSGLVAYELARLLRSEGEHVERLVLVNASPMPTRCIPILDTLLRRVASNAELAPKLRDTLCYNLARFHAALVLGPKALVKLFQYAVRTSKLRSRAAGGAATAPDPEPFAKRRGARETENSFAHIAAGFSYHPQAYDGEVTLVWADEQDTVEDDSTAGWGAVAASVRIVRMGGGHIAGLNERIAELASGMEEALAD